MLTLLLFWPAFRGLALAFEFHGLESFLNQWGRVESNHLALSPSFTATVAFRGLTPTP